MPIPKKEEIGSFNALIEEAVKNYWDLASISDYKDKTLYYKDVARKIEKLHILFEETGVKHGDKIAICGRNSANWAVVFFATLTYGAVVVPLLHEFTMEQIHNCVNHSDAKLLFVGDYVKTIITPKEMPHLEGILNIPDFSLLESRSEHLTYARKNLNALFGKKYPERFTKGDIHYYKEQDADELAMINYTSGTTGHSKGVMLPYRALWSNLDFANNVMHGIVRPELKSISMLPMAHMYGMAFELIFEFCNGVHINCLTRVPSPAIITKALSEVKPFLIVSVPLILEKIIRKRVFPSLQTPRMKILMNTPAVRLKVREKICQKLRESLGGAFYEIIIGGAAMNKEVEDFLHQIDFPFTVGYGATECAPIICYADWKETPSGSCGKVVRNMELRIDSAKPRKVPGEILVRGLNVMTGYYKNEEETKRVFTDDGWLRTGDLGVIDNEGNIFIKGRCKNMLLGANGQNIYPEEIEDKLSSLPFVTECVVVQRDEKLIALVYPDYDEAANDGLDRSDLQVVMDENLVTLNEQMPAYSKVTKIELRDEEFEKTAKKSIRRFLYH